jgi:hypothetical protein
VISAARAFTLLALGSVLTLVVDPDSVANPPHVTGSDIQKRVSVNFGLLPDGWKSDSTVMDPIWESIGLAGVNFYAYGGPTPDSKAASRLDPRSRLYQAWVGVYVIADKTPSSNITVETASTVADLDQRSWLEAMGDPHPLGLIDVTRKSAGPIRIDGKARPLYAQEGRSHSDIGTVQTPLRKSLLSGAPEPAMGSLSSFHDLQLHGYFAFWTDSTRHVKIVVYSVAPSFKTSAGEDQNLFKPLREEMIRMMKQIRTTDLHS